MEESIDIVEEHLGRLPPLPSRKPLPWLYRRLILQTVRPRPASQPVTTVDAAIPLSASGSGRSLEGSGKGAETWRITEGSNGVVSRSQPAGRRHDSSRQLYLHKGRLVYPL